MELQPQQIIITDPTIIDFFNDSVIDPTKFMALAIQHKHLFIKNISTDNDTNIIPEELKRFKIDFYGLKKSQTLIKEKISELSKLIELQRLPFLEQSLNANRMIEKTTFDCPYCNQHTFLTKRALAGHTNHCRPLYEANDESNDEELITETA